MAEQLLEDAPHEELGVQQGKKVNQGSTRGIKSIKILKTECFEYCTKYKTIYN
jgi:hypothetical protein